MQPLYVLETSVRDVETQVRGSKPLAKTWGPGVGICVAEIFPSHNFGKTYRQQAKHSTKYNPGQYNIHTPAIHPIFGPRVEYFSEGQATWVQ